LYADQVGSHLDLGTAAVLHKSRLISRQIAAEFGAFSIRTLKKKKREPCAGRVEREMAPCSSAKRGIFFFLPAVSHPAGERAWRREGVIQTQM
jgi:hypothetical protein